jgi:hypothetical protein
MYAALAAVVMVAIGASQAQAVDGKLYPASMCVRWEGSEPLLNHSRLLNAGSTTLRLDCPVVRDELSGDLPGIQDGYVDVIDNHGTEQVCAELVAVSQFQSETLTVESSGRQCSPFTGFQSQRLSFGELFSDLNAHYYFSVSIPPVDDGLRSGIIAYEVDEEDIF